MNKSIRMKLPLSLNAKIGFSSKLFGIFGLLTLLYGVNAFLLPNTEPDHWEWLMSEENYSYFAKHWRWIGIQSMGLGLFSTVTAFTSFRRGEKWSWFIFWFWPVFFISALAEEWHIFVLFMPLALLSLIALLLPIKAFFPK